jgi:hypothetical protein
MRQYILSVMPLGRGPVKANARLPKVGTNVCLPLGRN